MESETSDETLVGSAKVLPDTISAKCRFIAG